jgi:glycosyltransferase involved in cell wall biosynthesis
MNFHFQSVNEIVHLFYQNTKKGGVDTFIINLINNWPQKKTIFKIYVNKSHPGIINLKKKIRRKFKIVTYDILLSQDLDKKLLYFYKSLIFKKIIRLILLAKVVFFKNRKIEKIIKNIHSNSNFFIINGGYQGGEACIKANLIWIKNNPLKNCFHIFHNNATKDKSSMHFIENFLRNKIDHLLSQSKTKFITVSKSCASSMKNRKNLKSKKIEIIYNGVANNCTKLDGGLNMRSKFKLKKNSKIILMLSVLENRKGFNFILKVCKNIFKSNDNLYLFIFGHGSIEEKIKIKKLIKFYGLYKRVFIQNFHLNTKELYKQSNVTVIPSQFNESFGYVSVESFLNKVPVVAAKIGGLKEIIKHKFNGYIVSKNNYRKFGYYILKSVNKKKNVRLINNAYKDAKFKFNPLIMSKSYSHLISK